MATLKEVRQRAYDYSSLTSERTRTSAIAGLAAAWLFSGSSEGDLSKLATAPDGLLWSGGFFAASLALDLLHYLAGSIIWASYVHCVEGNHEEKDELRWSPSLPVLPYLLYLGKVITAVIGYLVLGGVLLHAAN